MAVHNRLDLTRKCLPTLQNTLAGLDHEVLIVDDCSTDGTRDYLRELPAPYRVFLNERKGSFAINNNFAARSANGSVFCFLNNDTELSGDWYSPMRAGLERFADAGFIGNLQVNPATRRYDHMGVVFTPWLTPAHYGQHFRRVPRWLQNNAYTPWSAVTAACCITRPASFWSAGGFDEAYLNGGEDIDLCLRMHRSGLRHYVANRSCIMHHKGASPGRKKHNDANMARLVTVWGDYIRTNLVNRDARLFAQTYLRRTAVYPWKSQMRQFWGSLRIVAGFGGSHG